MAGGGALVERLGQTVAYRFGIIQGNRVYHECPSGRLVNMIRIPKDRRPTHPGEILREDFLDPMGMTQRELADGIKVPYQRVNEIVNGKRGVTPSTALRLARFFDTTTGFWLNLQQRVDLYDAQQAEKEEIETIEVCA